MCRRRAAQFPCSVSSWRTAIRYGWILLMSLLSGGLAWAEQPATVLHRFTGYAHAVGPRAGLVLASDGNYYGTRAQGGAFNAGAVFRMTPDGVVTTIYDFRGGDQGYYPNSPLTVGTDGALVGMMFVSLGESFASAAFRVARDGSAYEVLHRFDPTTEGRNSEPGRILLGRDGNFYGTLSYDETRRAGAVYRMTPAGTVTILHAFTGTPTDGARPMALVQGPDGGFFGVTEVGGSCSEQKEYCRPAYPGGGTLFSMTPAGAVTILHAFDAVPTDGFLPTELILGANGSLYGTTVLGPCTPYPDCGGGALFEWTPGGTYRVLTWMQGQPTSLMQAEDGTLYGTTLHAAAAPYCYRCGAVFKIGADGRVVYVHRFDDPPNGVFPHTLIEGSDGALYGTTEQGGMSVGNPEHWSEGFGTVFRLDRDDTFTVLHRFLDNDEGARPDAPLIQATDGNFYGTTRSGGIYNRGTVYRMTPGGGVQVLHTFTGGIDGGPPHGIVQASDGFLYGAVANAAANQWMVFRMSLGGQFSIIHAFAAPGPAFVSRLVPGANGLLYGVSLDAGYTGAGTIFHMMLTGAMTVIHRFSAGAWPTAAPLLQARDGYLYGTTLRNVYRIGPSGGFTELHRVSDTDALVEGRDGNIYGVSRCAGHLFRITPAGAFQVVTAAVQSSCPSYNEPFVGIATDRRGHVLIYGSGSLFRDTFPSQSRTNYGRIVAVGTDGTAALVHEITDPRNGDAPISLMQASDGRFYVTTAAGGTGGGTILRLNAPAFAPKILFSAAETRTGVTLTWSAVPGPIRYTIVRSGGTGGQTVVASDIGGTSFTDTTVVPGVVYSYVVIAIDAAGDSIESAAVSVPWLTPASRTPTVTTVGDYDGDGKADLTVYRGSTGTWFTRRSGDGGLSSAAWGSPLLQDRPVPADYDGDGVTDVAVYRETNAEWLVHRSSDGALMQLAWGAPALGDLPVPADYDGDGHADIAVYRATTGEWFIRRSTDRTLIQLAWGSPPHGDVPVPADYDGDGHDDIGVYRASTGDWLIRRSTDGGLALFRWGAPLLGDVPVPADYDGDGHADLAVYRATTGDWLIRRSTDGVPVQFGWGAPLLGDVPVVGDYDADGRADVAVYRELTGEWFVVGFGRALEWGVPALGDAVRSY